MLDRIMAKARMKTKEMNAAGDHQKNSRAKGSEYEEAKKLAVAYVYVVDASRTAAEVFEVTK